MAFELYETIPGIVCKKKILFGSQRAMCVSGEREVDFNTSSGGVVCGIIQDEPSAAGQSCSVAYKGVCKVRAGGSGIAAGQLGMSGTDGKIIPATAGLFFCCLALETATKEDQIITALIMFGYVPDGNGN